MGLFSKTPTAGLLNDYYSNAYHFMSKNIIEQRDANLRQLNGASVNNTELAIAALGDPHVTFCYDRLMETMSSFSYRIEAEDGDLRIFLEEQILNRRELLWESLGVAKVTGVAAFEVIWGLENQMVVPLDIVPVDSQRIVYSLEENDYKYRLRIATLNNNFEGEAVQPSKIVDYQYFSVYINNPYGLGCGGLLVELVKKKNLIETIWHEIAKKFSQPAKIGRVPDDATAEEVDEFFNILKEMKKSSTFILPAGFDLDIKEVSGSGDKIIMPLIDYYDEQISGLLLGESITGKELSNGAQSRDIVANDITTRKAFSLADSIATRLNNTLVKWLIAYNFPGETAKIVVEEKEDLKELLDSYEKLQRLGVDFDPAWLANKFGIPFVEKKSFGVNFKEQDQ